jgi:DNA-binding transcriptional LysR family regulator
MMRDTVGDLIAFIAVARAGSFTRAAVELGLTQPALSKAMRTLEERLEPST